MYFPGINLRFYGGALLIASAIAIVFYSVILGLVKQWWNDENYSHGLIVPFVIAFIVWQESGRLRTLSSRPEFAIGLSIVISGLAVLLLGTLGSELLTQRVSLIVVLAGTAIYFFGRRVLFPLAVPFILLLVSIPIPQIIFNKIAFPLQLLASRIADVALGLFGVSSQRNGNVINIVAADGGHVALEVVEACSGIRSLMTLAALALIFAYFTRGTYLVVERRFRDIFKDPNLWRTALLILSMVPVALATNAVRVVLTGIATYHSGQQVLDSWWHDALGWLSFGTAFIFLILVNWALSKIRLLNAKGSNASENEVLSYSGSGGGFRTLRVAPLLITVAAAGVAINWLEHRTVATPDRRQLSEFPSRVSKAVRMGPDSKFDSETEAVLGASDYVMRNYIQPPRRLNLYIGFYVSQRTGATYHSPLNCLPGTGWVMSDGREVKINPSVGSGFIANQYVVQQGDNRQIMIYWYQGRGRTNASEYSDKVYTIIDSIRTGRTDASLVRVLTPVYPGETDFEAQEAAKSFAADVYEALPSFVPD